MTTTNTMTTTLILFVFVIISSNIQQNESSTFDCDTDHECQNENLVCTDDEDCFIYCTRSCKNTHFTCPRSNNRDNSLLCQAQCGDGTSLSYESCDFTVFNAYSSNHFSLIIDSSSNGWDGRAAWGINITCPCDGYCDIHCGDGEYGCGGITVEGMHSELTISTGTGADTFFNAFINGSEASKLTIFGSGDMSFSDARIYCPIGKESKLCRIIYTGTDSYAFWLTHIYSTYSFNGVDIQCPDFANYPCINTIYNNFYYVPIMHCGPQYSESCNMTTIDGQQWDCEEQNSGCAAFDPLSTGGVFKAKAICTTSPPSQSPTTAMILEITGYCALGGILLILIIYAAWYYKVKKRNNALKNMHTKKARSTVQYSSFDSHNISMVQFAANQKAGK